jgi:hypothetical protein
MARGAMLEHQALAFHLAWDPKANVVLLVSPVDTDEGCEGAFFLLVHV